MIDKQIQSASGADIDSPWKKLPPAVEYVSIGQTATTFSDNLAAARGGPRRVYAGWGLAQG